jgi:hypothetical protein
MAWHARSDAITRGRKIAIEKLSAALREFEKT